MDTYYNNNGLTSNNGLPGVSPHQLQHNTALAANHTLPPLQAQQHATMSNNYGSNPGTPRTPATPHTPGASNMMNSYPAGQMGQQQQQRYSMPGYSQPQQQMYAASRPMAPQSSTAMAPQALAPAPNGRVQHNIRPMPPNGQHLQNSMSSPYGQGMMGQPAMMMEEQPTHVVGSQGRRGILPSAPGRPPVGATTGAKGTVVPQKDADGKFPCPHCTKTYLHAKHLKRHLLRHTGDRPYMCVLCRDTFSRSDILKRHFQKCSIRRGNPTGASHLSHAQAHLKKAPQGLHKNTASMGNDTDFNGANGLNSLDPGMHPFGVIPDGSVPDANSNLTDDQAAKRLSGNGGSMTGLGPAGSNSAYGQAYAGIASSMPTGMNPSTASNITNGQNGHSYNNQGFDPAAGTSHQPAAQNAAGNSTPGGWSQVFPPNSQNGQNGFNPTVNFAYLPEVHIKPEFFHTKPTYYNPKAQSYNPPNDTFYTGLYSGGSREVYSNIDHLKWNIQHDQYQDVSNRLINFCFPQNNQITNRSTEMRAFLSPDNIKHFLEQFSNFQVHFPIIHMPTFQVSAAYDGQLLAMICVGAVYSDRLAPAQLRDVMEFAKVVIESGSIVYAAILRDGLPAAGSTGYESGNFGQTTLEIEQITALVLMQILFTWHGTPIQREKARRQNSVIVALARKAGLTMPKTTAPYSALHQAKVVVEHFNVASFDWITWVEQEKRSRLMFSIFLLDAAMVIYFNTPPTLEMQEVRIPLPADDAVWAASTGPECAEALGLHGTAVAENKNPSGSRRPKQPEMHTALTALMHPVYNLQPGSTNLYSKFVLVHALHVQLWQAQRQQSQEAGQMLGQGLPYSSAGSTPLAQNDWVTRAGETAGSAVPSANNSGRVTPVESAPQSPMTHKLFESVSHAFEKWKTAWDEDMTVQYPPSTASRRFGFCRDAVHFYWLAKMVMQTNLDWQMAPDQRFGYIIASLKLARKWAVPDSNKRGEKLGSVNDIDSNFGVNDLTLNMAQLFTPINSRASSPTGGVHIKYENGMA